MFAVFQYCLKAYFDCFYHFAEPEGTARTILSLCELASEACTTWFPAPAATENK